MWYHTLFFVWTNSTFMWIYSTNSTLGQDNAWQPVTSMFIVDRVEDVAYYQDLAQDRNPLLNQVSLKRQLAEEGVRARRSDFLPQVAAIGGGSFYNYQVSGIVPRWAVGVGSISRSSTA